MSDESQRKVTSFRIRKDLMREAKHKARRQGRTMTEVIHGLLRAYIGINSPIDELETEKIELQEKKDHLEAQISEIENEIKNKKGEIPDQILEYLEGPFQDQESGVQIKRIREFSRSLDMEPEDFVDKAQAMGADLDGF